MEGYCMECKATREIRDPKVTGAGGRAATAGTCPVCNKRVFAIEKASSRRKGRRGLSTMRG